MKNKKLSAAEYWEWRTSITELHLSEEKFKVAAAQTDLLTKDIEILTLRARISKQGLTTYKENIQLCKNEYVRLKTKIEENLKISLNNKVIDDVTFEIKELEEGN